MNWDTLRNYTVTVLKFLIWILAIGPTDTEGMEKATLLNCLFATADSGVSLY